MVVALALLVITAAAAVRWRRTKRERGHRISGPDSCQKFYLNSWDLSLFFQKIKPRRMEAR